MYKIKYALKKCRPVLIVVIILWIMLSIVFVAPVTVSRINATNTGQNFMDIFLTNIGNIKENFFTAFKGDYISTFLKGEGYLTIVLLILGTIGLLKTLPKNEYTDIEHGSSDWATGGEQYKILNPKKGILLAEKNYLPVDKRGNVNVLIVGRFRFW